MELTVYCNSVNVREGRGYGENLTVDVDEVFDIYSREDVLNFIGIEVVRSWLEEQEGEKS